VAQLFDSSAVSCSVSDSFSTAAHQTLSNIEKPHLTGYTVIDAEHDECTITLNALLSNSTSVTSLDNAVVVLSSHFAHEEDIMRAKIFGEGAGGATFFSAMEGHSTVDHASVIDIARMESSACSNR
jgi:hypothetical protein